MPEHQTDRSGEIPILGLKRFRRDVPRFIRPLPLPAVISSQAWMRRAARLNGLSLTSFTIPFFPRDKVAGKQFMPLIPRPRPGGGSASSCGDGFLEPGLRPLNRKLGRSRRR